jgi:hypothetical protein
VEFNLKSLEKSEEANFNSVDESEANFENLDKEEGAE